MKKFLDVTMTAMLVAALTGAAAHFQVKNEVVNLFRNMAHKIAPWVDTIVYS